ncbi:MAG: hypothetical protein MZV64_03025 [Ignavibacteriales bacterium]|nr:hypothetical protein [Ignavibacteriales bacterium]
MKGTIDKFEIRGNDKTSDDVIIRELRIKQGELYSQKEIDELPKKLNRLRFLNRLIRRNFILARTTKELC